MASNEPVPAAPASAAPAVPEPHHEHAGAPHWTYGGDTGPAKWGELSPEWAACKTGTHQSPIDLLAKTAEVDKSLKPLKLEYGVLPLQIVNNGHTVQVAAARDYGLRLGDEVYKLAQFHLHAPSEHSVAGKLADMELHLVHKNAKGGFAVLGLLFKKGKENKVLSAVFANAPSDVTAEAKPVEKANVDLAKLVPANAAYYTYPGSLTTPPCTEGVRWLVLLPLLEVSEAQIAKFRDVTHGDTNRPVQVLSDRKLKRSR